MSMASEASAAPVGAGDKGGRRVVMLARHRCSGVPFFTFRNPSLPADPVADKDFACLLSAASVLHRVSVIGAPCDAQGCRCAGKLKRFHEMLSLYAGVQAVEDLHDTGEARTLQRSAPRGEGCVAPASGGVLDDTRKVAELLVHDILARHAAS